MSKFNKRTTAEQVTDGIDLSGKVAVVTGVNSGIGNETARVLALRGARILGTARTLEKASVACHTFGNAATPVECELEDLSSIRSAIDTVG